MAVMTTGEFVEAILTLAREFRFSVTSWGRSPQRNAEVGGHPESWHRAWLAVDVVLDAPQDQERFVKRARRLGLQVVMEADHLHLEVPQ